MNENSYEEVEPWYYVVLPFLVNPVLRFIWR